MSIAGKNITQMTSKELHWFRNTQLGFVFQFHYLLAELTVLENVLVPALKLHEEKDQARPGGDLIAQFGLARKNESLSAAALGRRNAEGGHRTRA